MRVESAAGTWYTSVHVDESADTVSERAVEDGRMRWQSRVHFLMMECNPPRLHVGCTCLIWSAMRCDHGVGGSLISDS